MSSLVELEASYSVADGPTLEEACLAQEDADSEPGKFIDGPRCDPGRVEAWRSRPGLGETVRGEGAGDPRGDSSGPRAGDNPVPSELAYSCARMEET
jgi:hypothetical protein